MFSVNSFTLNWEDSFTSQVLWVVIGWIHVVVSPRRGSSLEDWTWIHRVLLASATVPKYGYGLSQRSQMHQVGRVEHKSFFPTTSPAAAAAPQPPPPHHHHHHHTRLQAVNKMQHENNSRSPLSPFYSSCKALLSSPTNRALTISVSVLVKLVCIFTTLCCKKKKSITNTPLILRLNLQIYTMFPCLKVTGY